MPCLFVPVICLVLFRELSFQMNSIAPMGEESGETMSEKITPARSKQAKKEPQEDNRGRVRHRCKIETFCRSNGRGSGVGWLADVRDISATGIGLTLRRRFDPGAVLLVELTSTTDDSTRLLPVTVIHATEADDGRWVVGCSFPRTLSDAELAALVLNAPKGRVFA